MSLFDPCLSGDTNSIVTYGILLTDVHLSLVSDSVCKVTRKIDSVLSAEVLNEILLWGVSEKLLLSGDIFSLI